AELDVYAERVSDPYVRSWQMFTQGPRLSASGDLEAVGRLGVDLETQADALGIPAWGRLVGVWLRASWTLHAGHAEEFLAQTGTFEALPNGEAARAFICAVNGLNDEAREAAKKYLERFRLEGEEWADRVGLIYVLDVAIRLEDRALTQKLAARLDGMLPFSNNNFGTSRGRILGRAAMLLDDPEKARAHFEDGLAVARKIEHRPESALVRYETARLLFEHYPDERAAA